MTLRHPLIVFNERKWIERTPFENSWLSLRYNHWIREMLNFVKYNPLPPYDSHSKDGQGHKKKYLDTSTKILSQEMLTFCHMKVLAVFVEI